MAVKRVVVRLTREEKQMLRELATWNQTSMTEMVRRLIDEEYEARIGSEANQGSSCGVASSSQKAEENDG